MHKKPVKRTLRQGAQYVVTGVEASTDPRLVGQRIRVDLQLPDAHLGARVIAFQGTGLTGTFEGQQIYFQGQVRLHQPRGQVCVCRAYDWPHRLGSGPCWGTASGPFCGDCGRPTESSSPKRLSVGLSACCGAKLFADAALNEEYT